MPIKPLCAYINCKVEFFWFGNTAHEIVHILNHFDTTDSFFIGDFNKEELNELEKEVNENAIVKLRHKEIYECLKTVLNKLSQQTILTCANSLQIYLSIIIGKLAHEKTISFSNQTLWNENGLDQIEKKYIAN